MGKLEIKMPEQFLLRVSKLAARTDFVIPKMLKAGGGIVEDRVRTNLREAIGKGLKFKSRSTGELVSSLGLSPALIDRSGRHSVKIGFSEPRRKQPRSKGSTQELTNAMIANVLEYGKSDQLPRPFLEPAMKSSRKACIDAMQQVLESEVASL